MLKSRTFNQTLRQASSTQKGFTLLEVMMAMLVFVSVALIQQEVTASTVNQYLNVRYKIVANWIAENKITELQLADALPALKETKEEIKYADDEWEVVSKVSKTANADIHQVEVDIYLIDKQGEGKHKKLTLSGMVGRY